MIPPRTFLAPLSALALLFHGTAHAACGDAISDPGEACDDGNLVSGDGCDGTCAREAGFACDAPSGFLFSGVNQGFETDDGPALDLVDAHPNNFLAEDADITGWTNGINPVDLFIGGGPDGFAWEGNQAAKLVGASGAAFLEQTFPATAGDQYRVTFHYSKYAGTCLPTVQAAISAAAQSIHPAGTAEDFEIIRTRELTSSATWPEAVLNIRATGPSFKIILSDVTGMGTACGAVVDDIRVARGSSCEAVDSDGDGLSDIEEDTDRDGFQDANETSAFDDDSDDDGLSDLEEVQGLGILAVYGATDPLNPDSDDDGVQDGTELGRTNGTGADTAVGVFRPDLDPGSTTNPRDDDTDDDGLSDGFEDTNGNGRRDAIETNVLQPDTDGDGIPDGTERGVSTPSGTGTDTLYFVPDADAGATTTNPLVADSDGGGLDDGFEDANQNGRVDAGETDPRNALDDDLDGDGLTEGEEDLYGTDPDDADSDDDGLSDLDEVRGLGVLAAFGPTNPANADTDGDGLADGVEVGVTVPLPDTNAALFRADGDPTTTSDPNDDDIDDDGLLDGTEDADRDGRRDANETGIRNPDTDADGILDGTEFGLALPQGSDTLLASFRADLDPASTTDPLVVDTDAGGIPDGVEDANRNGRVDVGEKDPTNPTDDDSDGDGVTDADEIAAGTDPNDADSDGDGLTDGEEEALGTDPNNADSDSDGLTDGEEIALGTDPNDRDSDDDRIEDGTEVTYGTDPLNPDTDGDGLNDLLETQIGTNPLVADGDDDGLNDGQEVALGTDPDDADSDNDGLLDGEEAELGTDPLDDDPDNDGLNDFEEVRTYGSDPFDVDSDDDALLDRDEVRGTGPLAAWGITNPTDPDTDGDGIQDGTEIGRTTGGLTADTDQTVFVPDADPTSRTSPLDGDHDDDGLGDGAEDASANGRQDAGETDPDDADSDNDGLTDGQEAGLTTPGADTDPTLFVADADPTSTTDPLDADSDGGGVPDDGEDLNLDGAINPGETDPNDPTDDGFAVDADGDGLADAQEDLDGDGVLDPGETDPRDIDTDDDGIGDADETYGTGPLVNVGPTDPSLRDTDGDGVDDGTEIGLTESTVPRGTVPGAFTPDADPSTTTDPNNADSDSDELVDGNEDLNHNGRVDGGETDPNDADSDADGIDDGVEDANHDGVRGITELNPLSDDSDNDGIGDILEDTNANGVQDGDETSGIDGDSDDDGLGDATEDVNANGAVDAGETDPRTADSDADGVADGVEGGLDTADNNDAGTFVPDADPTTTTDPLDNDSDDDGLSDGDEDTNHNGRVDPGETDPNAADTDEDGLGDMEEADLGTDPLDEDSDNDGFSDGFEVEYGTDPNGAMRAQGASGCNTSGSSIAWLGLLALPLLRRRRAIAALALTTATTAAIAQDSADAKPRLDAQRFDPLPQGNGFTLVRNDAAPDAGAFGAHLAINYGYHPLELADAATGDRVVGLVDNLLGFNLGIFGTPTDWLKIGVDVPVLQLALNGSDAKTFGAELGASGGAAGLGDITVDLAFQPLRQSAGAPLSLTVAPQVVIPSGSRGLFVGSGAVGVGADVTLGRRWDHFRFSVGGGYRFLSQSGTVSQVRADDEARWQVGLGVPLADNQFEIMVEHLGAAVVSGKKDVATDAFGANHTPMEVLLSGQYRPKKAPMWVTVGVGRGLTAGFGEPEVRAFADVGMLLQRSNNGDNTPHAAADQRDDDKDGIVAAYDQCPEQREDRNGYQDDDGCPDNDSDFDGVTDDVDQCLKVREDIDLFQDGDGCPEPDNDNDNILDVDDDCPKDKEILNGLDDSDGCPDDPYASVDRARGEIVIAENVYFETGTAVLKPASTRILDSVATLLVAYPSISKIEIAGHTDARGNPDDNLSLSQQRSEAVRDYLVKKGIDAGRLDPKGYGSSAPIVPDATSEADHALNRRVEFRIMSESAD
jgi:cysteine-rich repeat protein